MRISDWSSDVCSSDLKILGGLGIQSRCGLVQNGDASPLHDDFGQAQALAHAVRECRDAFVQNMRKLHALQGFADAFAPPRGGNTQKASGIGQVVERRRSEEHTSELQSLMRISYAV